jgi:hypothetical protein
MKYGLMLAAAIGGAALLSGGPARAAIAPVRIIAAPGAVAGPSLVQHTAYWWHGRRYWHRRWAPRRFYGGVWVTPHWVYY